MKKLSSILNLILFLLPLSTFGQYVLDLSTCDFTTKSVELPRKKVEYIENGIIVTYEISTVGLFEDDLFPGSYHFSIPGFSEWTEAGLPAILNCVNSFVIPPGSKPKIQIVNPINGNIISSCPLDRTITDQKATVRIRCAGGVMIAYLMAGSPVSSMKMYISK